MSHVIAFLNKQSRTFLLTLSLVLTFLVAAFDYFEGQDVSFLIFYLLPVFISTWFVGRAAGMLTALVSLGFWGWINVVGFQIVAPIAPLWGVLARAAFFLIIPYLMSELKNALDREKELARLDPLTRIANRRALEEYARLEIERARRYAHPLTIAYLDIDNFKSVNDSFGHRQGDTLLKDLAQNMRRSLRAIDFLARLGGDEFVILLPETGAQAGLAVTRKLERHLLELAREHDSAATFSIGIVTFEKPPESVEAIIQHADRLMYRAKQNGKNRIVQEEITKEGVRGYQVEKTFAK